MRAQPRQRPQCKDLLDCVPLLNSGNIYPPMQLAMLAIKVRLAFLTPSRNVAWELSLPTGRITSRCCRLVSQTRFGRYLIGVTE